MSIKKTSHNNHHKANIDSKMASTEPNSSHFTYNDSLINIKIFFRYQTNF